MADRYDKIGYVISAHLITTAFFLSLHSEVNFALTLDIESFSQDLPSSTVTAQVSHDYSFQGLLPSSLFLV